MSQVAPPNAQGCVNHPERITRVRCSSCGRPICPKCMRESAVGMKCPDCARQPRRAVRPRSAGRYAAAAAGGLGAATLLGVLIVVGRVGMGMFGILIPLFAGFLVGEVVSRMAHRLGGTGFQVIAGVSTVVGLVVGMSLGTALEAGVLGIVLSGPMIVWALIAAAIAVVRVGR